MECIRPMSQVQPSKGAMLTIKFKRNGHSHSPLYHTQKKETGTIKGGQKVWGEQSLGSTPYDVSSESRGGEDHQVHISLQEIKG